MIDRQHKTVYSKGNMTVSEKEAVKKAEKLGEEATEKDIAEVESKLFSMNKGVVKKVWDKVLFLWEQFKSPDVPVKLKATIIGALLYLILPIDIIPDAIPVVGFLDDVAVILFVFKQVSDYAVPKVVDKTKQIVLESCYKQIDKKLHEITVSTIICTCITFVLNAAAFTILILRPLGRNESLYTASAVFGAGFIYALVRTVLYIIRYGKITFCISKSILKERSIKRGLSSYIVEEYSYVSNIYAGIYTVKKILPGVEIPDLEQIVKLFEDHYKKKAVMFGIALCIYFVLFYSVRSILLSMYL